MQTLCLDENNNILVTQGNITVIDKADALAQDVKTRIGLCFGENPFNLLEGIDFDNQFLGKKAGQTYYKQALRNRILEHPHDINQIESVDFSSKNDKISLTINIDSVYGAVNV